MNQDSNSAGCSTYSPEELAQFLDGTLSPGKQQRMRQHLRDCDICRQRLHELESVRTLLQQSPTVTPPRSFTLSERDVQARQRILWYPILRSASTGLAVLVLLLFLVSAFQLGWQGSAVPTPRVIAVKPTPLSTPSPRSVVVDPMLTRRALPTSVTQPGIMAVPTEGPIAAETSYPLQSTPWIGAASPRPTAVASPQAGPPPPTSFWMVLRLGGLLLLGLCVGMTWVAYRRERMFFS
jgi:hypothetical protein